MADSKVSKKKKVKKGIYMKNIITRKVVLSFQLLGNNIKENLKSSLKTDLEGKCSSEGYIKSDSINIISYSAGIVESENVVLKTDGNTMEDVAKTLVDTAETVKDVSDTVENVESGNVVAAATDVVKDVKDVKNVVADVKEVKNDVEKVLTSSGLGEDNTVTENYNEKSADSRKVFEGSDPWLDRKQEVEEVD